MEKRRSNFVRIGLQTLLCLTLSIPLFSQSKTITGKVTDAADSRPLPGATVQVKGTQKMTSTDDNGNYSIEVLPGEAILVFSYTGAPSQERPIGNNAVINVSFTLSGNEMGEVIVIGYGTQRKSDLTGAVGSVKATQLQERAVASLNQALAGRIPGVWVNSNSGRPGGQTTVRIRGFSSINTTNNPLYVVDGVILPVGSQNNNSNAIDYINGSDIASVEVLKDASSTAIYGARGANGVILVSTKRGSATGPRVTYDGSLSVPTIGPNRVEMLDANEYLAVENLTYDNIKVYDPTGWATGAYASVVDPREKRKSLPRLFDANGNPLYNTDWYKEATQNKLSQNHQLGLVGGNKDNNYGIFLGYRDENGLLLNSYLKRYSARFVTDATMNDWLKVGGGLSYNNQEENIVDQGTGGLNSVRMITESFPFLPVKYSDGTWGDNNNYPGAEGGSNPVHILTDRKLILQTQNVLGYFFATLQLAKGLQFKSQVGANIVTRQVNEYNARSLFGISFDQRGTAVIGDNRETYWSSENFFTYDNQFGEDHAINAMAGLSWQETNIVNNASSAQNFSTDYFVNNNIGAGSLQQPSASGRARFTFNSYFGRINYSLKDRYLFTVTGRADGASKFGVNNKYSFFPSAAIAWRISEEGFLKGSNLISHMKLRSSYGLTGNSEISSYASLGTLSSSYAGIFNNTRVTGVGTGRLANNDLAWEKTQQADIGLEVGVLNNRISLELDVYYRKTTDMLLNAPVPASTGYLSITRNVGSMENKGLEIGLNTVNITGKDLTWTTNFGISFNKNKVLELATPADIFGVGGPNFTNQTNIIRKGEPVGSFWGLVRLGVWQESEREEAAKFSSYRAGKPILPGDIKYLDVNSDHIINDEDRMIIGNGNPDYWGSFSNTVKYKNFELILDLQFSAGNDILNMSHHSGEDRQGIANSFKSVLQAWTPDKGNSGAEIAAIRDTRAGYVTNVDTRWVEDGSFLRGRNLSLSYEFPAQRISNLKLAKLKVYGSVQNFFLVTDYSGNDPEVTTYGNAFSQGQTFFDYPKPTTFTLGVNVAF
ncbi:MAG: TonB-dependent receptor [Candidatus Pseudobacter hemicellulosilyticus]|uniref:TonB-dependent receptor n=1 Tax=Candidatus Pseudobacter hemicellulosilyticus TaxID=3121375 RepID=A0AAJ5WTT0_9BACT|nr:MAG: TonB-dependent receptor [Pseudobacter sp.]